MGEEGERIVKRYLAERPARFFTFGPFVLVPERQLLMQGDAPVRIGGRALGLGMTGGDPLANVIYALKFRHAVLLFDNCEHLLPAVAADVDRITAHLDDARILATSREPLRIRGERVHRLGGLECETRERPTAEQARRFLAVELFATRASERAGWTTAPKRASTF